jgi:hypothetical protein
MTTPRLSPGTQLSLMRATNPVAPRVTGDGRVAIIPSPDGTVHLNVHTIDGRWVTDHVCLPEDVDTKLIRALERRAKKHEGVVPIAIVR